jgi:hypothetical protein
MFSVKSSFISQCLRNHGAKIIQEKGKNIAYINNTVVVISRELDEYSCNVIGDSCRISQKHREWSEDLFDGFIENVHKTTKSLNFDLPFVFVSVLQEFEKYGTLMKLKLENNNALRFLIKIKIAEKYNFSETEVFCYYGNEKYPDQIEMTDKSHPETERKLYLKDDWKKGVAGYATTIPTFY